MFSDTNLLDVSVAVIFSYHVSCLFSLLIVFFDTHKFFILMKFSLSFFFLLLLEHLVSHLYLRKPGQIHCSAAFPLCFLLRALKFKFLWVFDPF